MDDGLLFVPRVQVRSEIHRTPLLKLGAGKVDYHGCFKRLVWRVVATLPFFSETHRPWLRCCPQFLLIEIARNREGCHSGIRQVRLHRVRPGEVARPLSSGSSPLSSHFSLLSLFSLRLFDCALSALLGSPRPPPLSRLRHRLAFVFPCGLAAHHVQLRHRAAGRAQNSGGRAGWGRGGGSGPAGPSGQAGSEARGADAVAAAPGALSPST